ncbi:hypothetical protein TNIN_189841 [Trichonephila inaurata madagascariensis]|uniref:Uncharacterized protein n=1 Tax=Trichonephila inaurata madagascariensis TaxID=2747483 RepID=A0A8X6XWA9_9ARAC|nr:hypothetical protein TNIN_255171 [Trichonephila inaurata madagascariensis]GFY60774.1 hypothetical protein TNIN_363521 [Trichonephila inaurata madagascariensis]GFY71325.1 hypothetical protein TNIN_189841 [Trichonephila inaurata madagascariensis]
MQEYLTLGHMELVPKNDYAKKESLSSSSRGSTRLEYNNKIEGCLRCIRAKSTTGHSLNDLLMVGPRVQFCFPLERFKWLFVQTWKRCSVK